MSCTVAKEEPTIGIEKDYVNQQIRVLAPDNFNSFKSTSPVTLEIQYHATDEIVFPNNYNVRIFKQVKSKWVEVKEIPTVRLPKDDIIFSAEKGTATVRLFAVFPDLIEYAQTYELRIYIIGDMKMKQEIKKVTAFIDVTLHP